MSITATITFPNTSEALTIEAPFESVDTATTAVETFLVGGLAPHVKGIRKTKAGKVEVLAAGCACFGHIIEDPADRKTKTVAWTITTKAADAEAFIRRAFTEGLPDVAIEVTDTDAEPAPAPSTPTLAPIAP